MSTKGFEETIDYNKEMKVVEEFLNIDSSLVEMEKNKDLIRMEMNIVEFPIFSKSNNIKVNQIKKYYFSTDKSSFLEIIPAFDTMIPGDWEERVFIAITKILRNNNFKQTFYCTINDIFDNMKIYNKTTRKGLYPKIRKAISKMATTTFRFKNLFYSNEARKILDDLVETNILTFRMVTLKDATMKESNFFTDKRTKEIFRITISQHFYENIIKKGYMAFDADDLLNIKDAVTRSIFTMITKWRYNNLYLKKTAYHIARRIPFAWDKNPRRAVLKIEKSLADLRSFNYIKDFNLNRNGKWERADFEIFFTEEHNKIKRDIFLDEKSEFDKFVHSEEERQQEVELNSTDFFTDEYFKEIFNTFPEVARKFKTLPNIIREALKKHDYSYVKYSAEYTAFFCKASYNKYFKDALQKNWADEFIAKKQLKEEKNIKKYEKDKIEEAVLIEENKNMIFKNTWSDFEALEEYVREKIELEVYEGFLAEANSTDNKIMRGIFEKSKKALILEYINQRNLIDKTTIKEKNQENIELVEEKIVPKVTQTSGKEIRLDSEYASSTHFILSVTKFVREHNMSIDLTEIAPIFKLFGEYEDFNIKISYDETKKTGSIIKK